MRSSLPESLIAPGARVALWGWGREGRAAYAALRRQPGAGHGGPGPRAPVRPIPLTVFCSADEAADARALDDPALIIETDATADRLAAFDVVIKSPGISPYCDAAIEATARGTRFIGGTALWFAARPDARTVCVTGTKGKSTTTALIAHLLRAGGHRTALVGNIGVPLLEVLDGEAAYWAIELSSYQTRDIAASGTRPDVAVVTNVYPEHLDWHGSEERYVDDKLSLIGAGQPHIAVLDAADATLRRRFGDAGFDGVDGVDGVDGDVDAFETTGTMFAHGGASGRVECRWYARPDGWHLRGDALHRGDTFVLDTSDVPLPGRHNRGNLCAALAAIDALGVDAALLAIHAHSFRPLPHRLQTLGVRDGISWINDSISTTPHATLAALDVFRTQRVALLVGGHDRGLDWSAFAETMRDHAPLAIVTMGQNGGRIHALLEKLLRDRPSLARELQLFHASGLGDAVAHARAALDGDGVLLMSPGAPSFGAYRDYTERGRHFATLAGFDPHAIASIEGLGIA